MVSCWYVYNDPLLVWSMEYPLALSFDFSCVGGAGCPYHCKVAE